MVYQRHLGNGLHKASKGEKEKKSLKREKSKGDYKRGCQEKEGLPREREAVKRKRGCQEKERLQVREQKKEGMNEWEIIWKAIGRISKEDRKGNKGSEIRRKTK
jgi:hypothetical protein